MTRTEHYPASVRALHWTVAALLPLQWALGFIAERSDRHALAEALFDAHFQLGVLLFALALLRIAARLSTPAPAPLRPAPPRWQAYLARGVHLSLYALLLALPASGYVIWVWAGADRSLLGLVELPALFTPPRDDEGGRALAWYLHVYGAWLLLTLAAMHAGAALWHQLVRRDDLIGRRMLRTVSRR